MSTKTIAGLALSLAVAASALWPSQDDELNSCPRDRTCAIQSPSSAA
jgi:hypothetical protein